MPKVNRQRTPHVGAEREEQALLRFTLHNVHYRRLIRRAAVSSQRAPVGLAMTPVVASATSRWRLTRESLACCSPIALPARRRRACLLRDTRFRSR